MIGVKMTEDTPASLFNGAKNAAWMIPIISGGIFFVPFFLLLKTVSLFHGKNLFAIIQKLLEKYIGLIMSSYFFAQFICYIV
jgi:spore germination protein KB